jgi:hypothetical protein
VAACVVPEEASSAESASEIEVEQSIARATRREAMQLNDGVTALVAERNREFRSGDCEYGHPAPRAD